MVGMERPLSQRDAALLERRRQPDRRSVAPHDRLIRPVHHDNRATRAGVNHITVHDGFTLADLFSYNEKHNEANGEDNRDGSNDNHSNNCGHEGPTSDAAIVALRRQLRKNQLACLFLALGTPLMLAGDEVGNSQNGNNNAYCQDNETGWVAGTISASRATTSPISSAT